MKKTYRRILLFVSVVTFLALAPLLTLYAIGYRLNTASVDPLPVGVVLIETVPSRANVYINDRLVGRTPHSAANLPVGPVQVRLELPGYRAWDKQIQVKPATATEIRDVWLVPETLPQQTIAQDVRAYSLAPNRRLLATVSPSSRLTIIDQLGAAISSPVQLPAQPVEFLWSPHSDALLMRDNSNEYFHVAVSARVSVRALPLLKNSQHVAWDPRIPDRILFISPTNTLQALNSTTSQTAILASDVYDFATSDRYIYTIPKPTETKTNSIQLYTLQGEQIDRQVPTPEISLKKIAVTPQARVAYQAVDDSVWVVDETNQVRQVSERADSFRWAPTGDMLLITTDKLSLHVYNAFAERAVLPLHELTLVTRLSRPIARAEWFAGGRHVVYQIDDELWLIEIDNRDHPVAYQLDTTNLGDAYVAVGEEGKSMFYLKQTGGRNSLIRSLLQNN